VDIERKSENDICGFLLKGRLDTQTSTSALEELLEELSDQPQRVLINLGSLEFISSAGLRVILRIAKEVSGYGGAIKVCEAKGVVKEVLEVSGFDSLLDLQGTEAAAKSSF
jgi:anti-anti-sigma factor